MNWRSIKKYGFVIYVLSGGAVHQAVAYIAYLLSAYAFIKDSRIFIRKTRRRDT